MLSFIQAGVSAGALSGPLLFTSEQAPKYLSGIRAVLGIFIALIGAAVIQLLNLMFLNKQQRKKRIANGKSGDVVDESMQTSVNTTSKGQMQALEEVVALDLTDRENDQFVYLY
jgi:hypothetical protein